MPFTTTVPDDDIDHARLLYDHRRIRAEHFAGTRFCEPNWDMLLFLFANQQSYVTTGELCAAGCVPHATGLRYIAQLEKGGLIERFASDTDLRVQHVKLSAQADRMMRSYLAVTTSVDASI